MMFQAYILFKADTNQMRVQRLLETLAVIMLSPLVLKPIEAVLTFRLFHLYE